MLLKINPQRLYGNWDEGWALDIHTIYSSCKGDYFWDTLRNPLWEALYELKYKENINKIYEISKVVA